MIEKTFGVCRLIYNLALETKIRAWEDAKINLSSIDLCYQIPELRKSYPWIKEVSSQSAIATVSKIDAAFSGFFKGKGFPKFKKKSNAQSFQCANGIRRIDWDRKTLTISKIKGIEIELSRSFKGEIKTITISKTATEKYFASVLVDNKGDLPEKGEIKSDTTIGIDVGIKSFAVTSGGKKINSIRPMKSLLSRLRCIQRRASRKKKGSNNKKKSNLCVAKLHEKIRNQRMDYCHKVTTGLIRDNQTDTFVIEDLAVFNMIKNRKLSQAISDVGFGEFFRQMQYKCEWYGKNLIKIGRFEPSSKTCSHCGRIKQDLTLADREWTCESCNTIHDRDLNAAINIKNFGLEQYSRQGMPVESVESRRLRRAKKQKVCILNT